MQELKLVGTFDSVDTAAEVTRALNAWFQWVMESNGADIPPFFEDFGLSSEEYALERENDTDWEESPLAEARGNHVLLFAYTSETADMLQELLEALGAFEVENEEDSDE